MIEEWVRICDGIYEVSNIGRVKRIKGGRGAKPNKILKLCTDSTGYLVVTLCVNGMPNPVRVHVLVAQCFIGDRPEGKQINHIDGVKTNNQVSNLEYITQAENAIHAGRNGLVQSGDNHWMRRRKATS